MVDIYCKLLEKGIVSWHTVETAIDCYVDVDLVGLLHEEDHVDEN